MHVSLVANGTLLTAAQPDLRVPWWSFSKTLLAAAALSLVRDGLIGLDAPVLEGPFTLRQLLRHEAGLADYCELPEYPLAVAAGDAPWSTDEMLQRLDAQRLRYAPGEGWRYSNVGYTLVAQLIQRVTGLSLEAALQQRVLLPLGLTQVRLAKTSADLVDVCMGSAAGYDPGWVYHGLLVGPLAQASLALDGLLAGQLLPDALLREMQAVTRLGGPIPGRPWTSPGYALGLMIGGVASGLTLCGHTGVGPGSVVVVYRGVHQGNSASCAVFSAGGEEGGVERLMLQQLSAVLGIAAGP